MAKKKRSVSREFLEYIKGKRKLPLKKKVWRQVIDTQPPPDEKPKK
jgi:hypothetical protein